MITWQQFAKMVEDCKKNPTELNLQGLSDDLGYIEILLALVSNDTLDSFAGEDGPLFANGDINWPSSFKK